MDRKIAVIVGAGPAGLTAAYELLQHTDILPIVYEASDEIGGICKTVNYKGNRIDIGGHRFFSKSDRVISWWKNILPLQGVPLKEDLLPDGSRSSKRNSIPFAQGGPDPEKTDKVMLIRHRISRIYFLKKFFDYPFTLNLRAIAKLGFIRFVRIVLSYSKARLFPVRPEVSLEDFIVNRFGKELYLTFFKSYTEKVWGISSQKLKAEWGEQRIKGISLWKTISEGFKSFVIKDKSIEQKKVETSLIHRFMYPKYGPGQMWDEVARIIEEKGGQIYKNSEVRGIKTEDNRIQEVSVQNSLTSEIKAQKFDLLLSSMPVKHLIVAFGQSVPEEVKSVAQGLMYRDFIIVGVLLKKMSGRSERGIAKANTSLPDNWIYIQEKDVRVGRIQIYNNWSPYMVEDKATTWIGMEYFCTEGDNFWRIDDEELAHFAFDELEKIGIASKMNIIDHTVIRMPKAYPVYFGSYERFHVIRNFVDQFDNLFLIGRNGMHRYNNQDHSMLTAMIAVDNIAKGVKTKENIWAVNVEKVYLEEK